MYGESGPKDGAGLKSVGKPAGPRMADAAPSEEAPSFTSTLLDDLLPSLLLELDLRALCRMGGVCKLLQKTVDKMLKACARSDIVGEFVTYELWSLVRN